MFNNRGSILLDVHEDLHFLRADLEDCQGHLEDLMQDFTTENKQKFLDELSVHLGSIQTLYNRIEELK